MNKFKMNKFDHYDAENIILALIIILCILFADEFAEFIADNILSKIF